MKRVFIFVGFLFSLSILGININKYYGNTLLDKDLYSYILDEENQTAKIKAKDGVLIDEMIEIPRVIEQSGKEYIVVSIFESGFENQKNIKKVILPDTLITIEKNSFFGCSSLISVIIGKNLEFIGDYAFYNCRNLIDINMVDSITTIESFAFAECISLKEFNLPAELTKISKGLFYSSASLEKINIPSKVKTIEDYAFSKCVSLNEVSLNNGLVSIGIGSFSGLESLERIIFPDTLTSIQDGAFEGCVSLLGFDFPTSLSTLGVSVLKDCINLKEVNFLSLISAIPNSTFMGCSNLSEVVLPSNVVKIDTSAFFDCKGLLKVTFLGNIESIENAAFSGCIALEATVFKSSLQRIPSISNNAFYGAIKNNIYVENESIYQSLKESFPTFSMRIFVGLECLYIKDTEKQYAIIDPIPEFSFVHFDMSDANDLIIDIKREPGETVGVYKYLPHYFLIKDDRYKVIPSKIEATLTINKGIYDVSWPEFDDLYYGQSLDDIKAVKKGSQNGKFVFEGEEDLVIGENIRTLRFIHNDQNYQEETKEYTIMVTQLFVSFKDDFHEERNIYGLYGNIIKTKDFPSVTKRAGYQGIWDKNQPIILNGFITINAIYTLNNPNASILLDGKEEYQIVYDGSYHKLKINVSHEVTNNFLYEWYIDDTLLEENKSFIEVKDANKAIYKVIIYAVDGSNISDGLSIHQEIEIKKKEITIKANDEIIIEGMKYDLTYQLISGTIYEQDINTGSFHTEYIDTPNDYEITLGTFSLGDNYLIEFQSGTLRVLKKIKIKVEEVTTLLIKLMKEDGVEYSNDGGKTFQKDNVFRNLKSNKTYKVCARYIGLEELGVTEVMNVETKNQPLFLIIIISGGALVSIFLTFVLKKRSD
ncbi:leucine-rich repeat protein [Acholeplasma sp. OttesenSCG-928-E16]|nr:leucine-rich repeat protein [Acholeplasma sp. OttesenSCG-928-E16]